MLSMNQTTVNSNQTISWLTSSIGLNNQAYVGSLSGLMGNYNGNKDDDLVSRFDGQYPSNMSERAIFDIASTCNLIIMQEMIIMSRMIFRFEIL